MSCAAKQSYPEDLPPAVNWTKPAACDDILAGLYNCQFGELGYAIVQTSNPATSAKFIYGTVTGGCKAPVNYYSLLGDAPTVLTDKKCTGLGAKVG